MDTMQVNKVFAAVLVSGIAFFVAGRVGMILVPSHELAQSAIKVDLPGGGGAPAAATAPAPEAEPLPALLAKADVAAGQKSTMQLGCVACHTFTDGGKNGLGPNLYNVVGRAAASHDGFVYSDALKGKGGNWSYDNLSAWLTKPGAYAAGTKMTFAGIANPQIRANVIAYLRSLSPSPVPLP
jgi:cytochrome c